MSIGVVVSTPVYRVIIAAARREPVEPPGGHEPVLNVNELLVSELVVAENFQNTCWTSLLVPLTLSSLRTDVQPLGAQMFSVASMSRAVIVASRKSPASRFDG